MRIDLNSDLGEHYGVWRLGADDEMLSLVTSANIPCGFHAGDPKSLLGTLRAAASLQISVGAHISYPDLVGFGRRRIDIQPDELFADTIYQIGALSELALAAGTAVRYIKPHGALYNEILQDEAQADAVIRAVRQVNPELPLLVLGGSSLLAQVKAAGLRAVPEAFADRAYTAEGALVSRAQRGAVIEDPALIAKRMLQLVQSSTIEAIDGTVLPMRAESICVHGDTADSVQIARVLRAGLLAAGSSITPFIGAIE